MNVAIIGGGLSGLLTAFFLEKKGYKPTIYERLNKLGGVIDSFQRKGVSFDVGFHYSGSLAPGQFLYEEFKKHDLLDKLEFYPYEGDFDTLYFGDEVFSIPSGSDIFLKKLQDKFPLEKENLEVFFDKCHSAGEIVLKEGDDFVNIDSRSVKVVLKDIQDPFLRRILLHFTIFYANVLYEDASFEIYSKIMIHMLDGTRKIRGNGRAIVDALTSSLKQTTIKLKTEVQEVLYDENGIKSIVSKDGTCDYDAIISTVHPRTTMNLFDIKEKKLKRYQKHINDLEESPSFFSLFCLVDVEVKSNLYFYSDAIYSILPSHIHEGKSVVTILGESSYKKYEHLDKSAYKILKKEESAGHLAKIKSLYNLGNREVLGSSTPLTKQHYSNGYRGSTYGILCSAKQKSLSMVMPKTRVQNLYLAGESALAPGLLGCYLGSAKVVTYFEDISSTS